MTPFLVRARHILLALILALVPLLSAHATEGDNKCVEFLQARLTDTYEQVRSSSTLGNSTPYLTHWRALNEFMNANSEDLEPKSTATAQEKQQFWDIVKRYTLKPNRDDLSVTEAKLIAEHEDFQMIFKVAAVVGSFSYFNSFIIVKILNYWQGQESTLHWPYQKTFLEKSKTFIRGLYNGPVRLLTSMAMPRIKGPTENIFKKQWRSKNGDYQPTAEEWATLEQFNAKETFLSKRQFMKENLNWSKFRKVVGASALGLYIAAQAMLVNYGLQEAIQPHNLTTKEFLEQSENRLGPNQIRLYNESVPFPHMAIEINGTVYSYGQTHMTAKPVAEYLQADEIQKIFAKDGNVAPDGVWNQLTEFGGSTISHLTSHLGPRSVQMVTLNLTSEGYARVQRRLELARGMRYRNETLAMDCATMIKYAIQDSIAVSVPPLLDASPGLTSQYLALLKTLGAKNSSGETLVQSFEQVTVGEPDIRAQHNILLRNLFINNVEDALVVQMLPFDGAQRGYLHLRYGQRNFQYLNPEVKAAMQEAGLDAVTNFVNGPASDELKALREAVVYVSAQPKTVQILAKETELQNQISLFVSNQIGEDQNIIDSGASDYINLIQAGFRMAYLKQLQQELGAGRTGQNIVLPESTLKSVLDQLQDLNHR